MDQSESIHEGDASSPEKSGTEAVLSACQIKLTESSEPLSGSEISSPGF